MRVDVSGPANFMICRRDDMEVHICVRSRRVYEISGIGRMNRVARFGPEKR